MGEFLVGGVRLYTEDHGTGEPVLLLGGAGMTGAAWDFSVRPLLLDAGYRVVAPDARGVGRSDAPPPPYSLADLTADAAGLIDALELGPCRVVGFSLGGFVAEDLVWRRPDLVRSAVLVASTGHTTAYNRARMRAEQDLLSANERLPPSFDQLSVLSIAVPAHVLQNDDATVERWLHMLSRGLGQSRNGRVGQTAAECDWLFDESRCARWSQLSRPCLVVAFEHDVCFPPRTAREAAGSMSRGTFAEIPGVAHGNGPFDATEPLARLVLDFWAGT
ncbi:MAG: alpha/beta hydrolase [Actinomycetota bacterium]|nr:alpha/beta hydrolase [Actinomycetota bacterium]